MSSISTPAASRALAGALFARGALLGPATVVVLAEADTVTEGDDVVFTVHTDKVATHARRPLVPDVRVAVGDEWSNEGRWS